MKRKETQTDKAKVLYIGGNGRSGSTLVGMLLGEVDGFCHVGELGLIWKFGLVENRLCGCGKPLRECEFWGAVFQKAFGGFDSVDAEKLTRSKQSIERFRSLPRFLSPYKSAGLREQMDEYARTLDSLYSAVKEVSGAKVIVDGTKAPQYYFVLKNAPSVDMYLLHLVRDSRAVAFSHQRRKHDPSALGREKHFGTTNPLKSATLWMMRNSLLLGQRNAKGRYSFMRYEDFVRDPAGHLRELCALVNEPAPAFSFLSAPSVHVSQQHAVGGNPNRFEQAIRIQADTEWQERIPMSHRALVTALTYPFLVRYGYGRRDR
ncbi:MAG TPA: sulfotransferase [Capsulimonadaceae bacterium]|nr:sulfotransferase [Capsulimonadaceae bacterium]